jgi:hypothetical protein
VPADPVTASLGLGWFGFIVEGEIFQLSTGKRAASR